MDNIIVVGGGLAGLTATAILAKQGYQVTLLEKAPNFGGRAITQNIGDFRFNLGPHALYKAGPGLPILQELGIEFRGGTPPSTALGLYRDVLQPLPADPLSLITTKMLNLTDKLEFVRFFATLLTVNPQKIMNVSFEDWLHQNFRRPVVRQLAKMLVRVSTYADAPKLLSAGVALRQTQMALKHSVYYIDGGWQILVNGLIEAARHTGATLRYDCRVETIEHDANKVKGVQLANGEFLAAQAIILAVNSPANAAALLPDNETLKNWATKAVPVRAACLDVALKRLPKPKNTVAFGIDQPLYLSIHSSYAKLALGNQALIHVAKYLAPDEPNDAKQDEQELEHLLDLVQPGWQQEVVERRFLPKMTVYNKLPTASERGLAGRPGPNVPGMANLFVAGDWVGSQGVLADAALVSAKQAALLAIHRVANRS